MQTRMRLPILLPLVAILATSAFVLTSSAAPPVPVSPVSPSAPVGQVKTELPARVLSMSVVKRGVGPFHYRGGPINYEVEVAAPTSAALVTNLIVERPWTAGPWSVKLPVNLPAGGHATLAFTDDKGLSDECGPSDLLVRFESIPVTGPKRAARINPSCTFTAEAVDPQASVPPDTKQAHYANKLSYMNAAIPSVPPKCGVAFDVTATIKNASAMATSFAELRFDGVSSQSLSVPLTPGASVLATVHAKPFRGGPGKHFLTLGASGPSTFQPGFYVEMSMSCTLDVAMIN